MQKKAKETKIGNWTLHSHSKITSTNDASKTLHAWHAVRANIQTAGRGRHGRNWNSTEGGLWLSAVIPASNPRKRWEILPLTTGWMVIETLQELGIENARLRWPNDIMITNKKICGILVERFSSHTAALGVGLNIHNQPEQNDSSLKNTTTRLANLLKEPPSIDELTATLLKKFSTMQHTIASIGWDPYRQKLNESWKNGKQVECTLEKETIRGTFTGVDSSGNLFLKTKNDITHTLSFTQVQLLREI
jgi:BirA family biotin operon repressor/biotin-[acetyl-CoA-carboxylase] ligase